MRPIGITTGSPSLGSPAMVAMARTEMRKAFIRFRQQRYNSGNRGIAFELTLADWLSIWIGSGRYHQRGRHRGDFVMSRPGDKGPYSVDNVAIVLAEVNVIEGGSRRPWSNETRAKIACRLKGNKNGLGYRHDAATLRKMTEALRARAQDPAWVAAATARNRSPEARRKNSLGVKAAWARRREVASP